MNCVEDAITFIDAMPLGEIVSVTVQKEQEVEGEEYIPYLRPCHTVQFFLQLVLQFFCWEMLISKDWVFHELCELSMH